MIYRLSQSMDHRLILAAAVALISLLVYNSYTQLFKNNYQQYQKLNLEEIRLSRMSVNSDEVKDLEAELNDELNQLIEHFTQQSTNEDLNALLAQHMKDLDQISQNHEVKLINVRPNNIGNIANLTELPFDVEVRGDYFSLYRWLYDVEETFPLTNINRFTITPLANNRELSLYTNIASYRNKQDSP